MCSVTFCDIIRTKLRIEMAGQRKGKAQNEEKSISGNIDSIKLHYVCGM